MNINDQIGLLSNETIDDKGKKLLFIVPESAGDIFLSTALLESLKEQYPDFNIYFACKPEYKSILDDNPYVYKVINYLPVMENDVAMEGYGSWRGLFNISILVTILTQRYRNYLHNGLSNIAFDLRG